MTSTFKFVRSSQGTVKDDMLSGMQEEMKDFLDLLSSGNNGEPPVQDGEANDGTK